MADDGYGFGSSFGPGDNAAVLGPGDYPASAFGGGGASAEPADTGQGQPPSSPPVAPTFGSSFNIGPHYTAPDPSASPLDQTADTLQQRINRANQIGSNPMLQFFDPQGVQRARDFVPKATEQLQTIRQQQAAIAAGKQQAATLGLDPGEVPDQATQEQRVEFAKQRALTGDLKVFKGLQAVDPKAAESIQDQVHEVAAGHLSNAQLAYDSLASAPNQGQYTAKLAQLRKDGTLTDLETLGLKVPDSFDQFNASKAREGQALREARIGVDTIRQKLEERNTYQPMGKDEAATYNGRMTTAYGDQITNGTWSRNASSGVRGFVVNGAGDPRDLGRTFTFATPEQRKALEDESDKIVPKEEREKYRAFNRTYQLATTDAKGNKLPDGAINTNPNVQQGIAEGLASMLRGGSGGANIGLLKIETSKRGFLQGLIDKISTEKGAVINELKGSDVNPYLSKLTQGQIRDVMDALKQYNDTSISGRIDKVAERAGALGLDAAALGYGDKESAGTVQDALVRGRQAQIDRMTPQHQAIGGGDGVFQLGAQRPGVGATGTPPGTTGQTTTQLPGAPALRTPVQQATQPVPPAPPGSGSGGTPPPTISAAQPSPASGPSGGGGPGAPITVAGQSVNVSLPPGASPTYMHALQRIESGNEKSPWTAGTPKSSAGGAFQMIDSTWKENRPPGAPDRARDATPQQQAQATATFTTKNAAALRGAGLPVNDTSLYMAHNVGAGPAAALMRADPNADARSIVGEKAAGNNPLFFKGKPTVATVLARYGDAVQGSDVEPPKPGPNAGGATAEAPGFWARLGQKLVSGDVPGGRATTEAARATAGPAVGSTLGAMAGGAVAGPPGFVAGGAAGGGAGQALQDYLKGNPQNPAEIAKQTALGGVLGVAPEGRPLVGAAARVLGAGGVEAADTALKGGDVVDTGTAAVGGAASAAGGEAFGRALGMVGHKLFTMFAPDAKKAVQEAAKNYAEASATLETEQPKLPGANGAAATTNPKYDAAEKAKDAAEKTLVDAGLKPEEAAYAHKVSSEGVPKQEAEVSRPGALEQKDVGKGYQQLESEVGAAGVGAPKASPKLPDGPIAAVNNGKVSKAYSELAQRTEAAITAPAKSWQEKWNQLKDARSALLDAERDALTSTESGRTQKAKDMRTLADTVRVQQEKVAKYVFGEKDGAAFMQRLKVLDTRYRNLMEATNGGDLAAAAKQTGEAGRDVDRKFRALAVGDPAALAAWTAMRKGGSNVEKDVRGLVAAEKIPLFGKVYSAGKMLMGLGEWLRERTAGSPAKFEDFLPGWAEREAASARGARDLGGTVGARVATQGGGNAQ